MPGPNRLGLGMRPPLPSYGQGPSMSALAQQQQMHHQPFMPPAAQKQTTLFVGSISAGITDAFLNQLLAVSCPCPRACHNTHFLYQACGPIKSFKRLITPANKPQGFGFAEFEEPDAALRAMSLLQGVELPALEDGCANKALLVRPVQVPSLTFTPTSLFLGQSRWENQIISWCLLGSTHENWCMWPSHSRLHFSLCLLVGGWSSAPAMQSKSERTRCRNT